MRERRAPLDRNPDRAGRAGRTRGGWVRAGAGPEAAAGAEVSATFRSAGIVVALLLALTHAPAAWAHASLVRSEPADGVVTSQPPAVVKLIFNEPVSPLVMRIIGPSG